MHFYMYATRLTPQASLTLEPITYDQSSHIDVDLSQSLVLYRIWLCRVLFQLRILLSNILETMNDYSPWLNVG